MTRNRALTVNLTLVCQIVRMLLIFYAHRLDRASVFRFGNIFLPLFAGFISLSEISQIVMNPQFPAEYIKVKMCMEKSLVLEDVNARKDMVRIRIMTFVVLFVTFAIVASMEQAVRSDIGKRYPKGKFTISHN